MAGRMLKRFARRAGEKLASRVGGRLVSRMADTSADAPAASFTPKRELYDELQRRAAGAEPSNSASADTEGEPAE